MSLINNTGDFLNQKRLSKQVSDEYHERTKRQLNNGFCPQKTDSLRGVRHLQNVYNMRETLTIL